MLPCVHIYLVTWIIVHVKLKVMFILQQAEVAERVPGRLRPRIFLTFGTTRVVDRQPYAPAAFTPGEIPGTHFSEGESTPWHMVPSEPWKKSPATPPAIDPETVGLVTQCLKHYATPGPIIHVIPQIRSWKEEDYFVLL